MKKRIFLVDDEIAIRENIRNCVKWEQEGFIYCGDASDGEMALPLIEELKPDILITDIKMPFMNGLELSTIVRQQLPDTKIILISGHDEFEYARQAVRIGVEDYCLKPIGSADLVALLHEVAKKIDMEAARRKELDRLTKSLTEKERLTREDLIRNLCGGLIATAEAVEIATKLHIPLVARYYAVILTDIQDDEIPSRLTGAGQQEVENAIARIFHPYADVLVSRRSRTERIWLLKSDHIEPLQHICHMFSDAIQSVESSTGRSIRIGIGSIQNRLQGVHSSFIEAEDDKHWRKITRQHQQTLLSLSSANRQDVFLDRDTFTEFLVLGSKEQAEPFISRFTAGLSQIDWQSTLFGYYALTDVTLAVLNKARKLYRNGDSIRDAIEELQRGINKIRSWQDACDYLLRLARLFWQWRAEAAGRYGDLIAQVKAYVQENYDKVELSLQDAAQHVNISPSHLSKIFSQETGQTFIDFLMKTRIRKAMELLITTNAKSYEIAFQVGYNDPSYFSNLFKRVTGMTIREFRKNGWRLQDLAKEEDWFESPSPI